MLTVGNMYPPHHLGGYELVWRGAVEDVRESGHEVRVVTTDYRSENPDPQIPEDPDVHRELRWYWRDHEFPRLGLRARIGLERHNRDVLERHLADFSPDVVSWWAMGGMSMSLIEVVRRRGGPAVGFVHDAWILYGPRVDAWHRVVKRLGPLATAVDRATGIPTRFDLSGTRWLFVSETIRRQALAAGHRLPDTAIAPSGIDIALFPRAPEKAWRGRLLCVGRIDPRKGLGNAVRALEFLPEASLAIVGSGDDAHASELRRLAEILGVEARVRFRGHIGSERLAEAYAGADAVLFPVLWDEPWGLVPLEAMATGVPVIATGAGGSGEYLRHEQNCLIFEPRDDPEALARCVKRLAADDELRRRLRQGGFPTAARFTQESFNETVLAELHRAARRRRPVA